MHDSCNLLLLLQIFFKLFFRFFFIILSFAHTYFSKVSCCFSKSRDGSISTKHIILNLVKCLINPAKFDRSFILRLRWESHCLYRLFISIYVNKM